VWHRERGDRSFNVPREREDRFPRVAKRLSDLRENLPECALKAYQALQMALRPHSRPHGSRPHFEKDFHESLSTLFSDAWDIRARQIGSWNQWEVQVDDGPPMYCSVRLEVLSDDPQFLRDIKSKAKIVKDTLLEDNAHWKRNLSPENGAFNWEKLSQFEKECAYRSQQGSAGSGVALPKRNNNMWVEPKTFCEVCGKSKDDDQLSGIHMCVVFATFHCPECRYSWTSYHGRLRPDHETLMGQQCSRCNGQGVSKDWRVVSNEGPNQNGSGNRAQHGMHQSELCDACQQFGNCMGVFYDPFVLTTALSLVSGQYVQWKPFSEEMPELLVADIGPQLRDLQVCLQPHVYVAQPQDEVYAEELTTFKKPAKSPGKLKNQSFSKSNRQDLQSTDNDSLGRRDGQEGAPRQRRNEFLDETYEEDEGWPRGEWSTGGVKDTVLLQRFLNKVEEPPQFQTGFSPPGNGHFGGRTGPSSYLLDGRTQLHHDYSTRLDQTTANSSHERMLFKPQARDHVEVTNRDTLLAGDEAGGAPQACWLNMMKPQPIHHPPAAEKVPKINKFNKISNIEHVIVDPKIHQPSTPLLDSLPPLRRAQFLQIVLRQVKASGGAEADKDNLAEEYLSRCNGDYEKAYRAAYQYMKALSEGSMSAQ